MHFFDVFPFESYDGFKCNLWRLQPAKSPTKGPVLLVHGAGVRSNIFNAPNDKNLLDALTEAGYDVWLENWRGSMECENNEWNLDIVADNDHPAAVEEVCRLTGYSTIKAIIHCQGSTSFMISAIKGLIPQVTTIISNAVSLHPVVSRASEIKIKGLVPIVKLMTSYLNPHWGDEAPDLKSKLFRSLVNLTHRENDTSVGKFVSFTYGVGHPALWELNNLTDTTKNWIREEFGYVPMSFFDHITKCITAGALVSADGKINYSTSAPKTNARFAFFAGKLNKCFRSASQVNTFNFFDAYQPDYHKLYLYDTYSHLDIFMGKNAYKDIFPAMIYELKN
ncbi:esterase [Pedobacter sp. L105]|uniref:alpha/beta hydrolase n=1 Tax=Pedobacter sp. L105 TaxID=1641871 RepID=UPI00131B4299|nr:esterase [Pedobacter sp. L105]